MYLNFVLNQLMKNIEDNISLDYLIFSDINKYYFYDPELSFEPRLHKRLALMNYEDREDPFICAMWSRSTLGMISEQSRKFVGKSINPLTGTGDVYEVKNVKCQLNLCFVSNDPEYITTFEEYFTINYDRSLVMKTNYKIPVTHRLMGSLISIDVTNKIFSISDSHLEAQAGDTLEILNSTGNDGKYTVSSINYDSVSNSTSVTVNENINSNIVDGELTLLNSYIVQPATIYFDGIEITQLDKLDTTSHGELVFLLVSLQAQYPVLQNITAKNSGGNGSDKIIKHIHFRTKEFYSNSPTSEDMVEPYDETIIE